ncbi:GNAT family N-acetyltransferase [Streptomyces sp. NBC_01275]|uniref:GNAT family N-acetyltransferase n=1 Tax=Streptomyces sp. NBC_01275 TaxID=2903807 RepID=UPI00224DAE29|nr:GNAT family N-acetyltransferase [Streptomyces sp. NBC_01275]MCX4760670.1 GNAT family N-acetyltransferase [Streptomyces sp. NBC_01275]
MTTTLRPTEPLQRTSGGALSRHFRVCVNSRPVGAIKLSTHPDFGPAVARVDDLRIEEPDRGRGRGAVAALAAEEVARSWGCRTMEIRVPVDAGTALRLATALGYLHRNRAMEKLLGTVPPELPPGTSGRPLSEAEYGPWRQHGIEEYAQSWISRGTAETEARAKAEADTERLLPQGPATKNMLISVLEHEGTRVGALWLGLDKERAYVYDVEADEAFRGQGHGRSLMLLAEAQAIDAGTRFIGLNVFAGNTPAERLYDSLGYVPVSYAMYKSLL